MAEAQVAKLQVTTTLNLDELQEVIRSVVREEIIQALETWAGYFEPTIIEPGSPIHEDLVELLRLKEEGKLELLSYEEVFGDGDGLSS
ncbi:MAG: hypothetical protein H8E47_03185 [Anaerolineales bacterium]|nr:hypothetical protein [Anaerolineales bacterium]